MFSLSYILRWNLNLFQGVPKRRFNDIVAKTGVGLGFAGIVFSSFRDGLVDGCGITTVGEMTLMPDLSTLRRIPWWVIFFLRYELHKLNFCIWSQVTKHNVDFKYSSLN